MMQAGCKSPCDSSSDLFLTGYSTVPDHLALTTHIIVLESSPFMATATNCPHTSRLHLHLFPFILPINYVDNKPSLPLCWWFTIMQTCSLYFLPDSERSSHRCMVVPIVRAMLQCCLTLFNSHQKLPSDYKSDKNSGKDLERGEYSVNKRALIEDSLEIGWDTPKMKTFLLHNCSIEK